MKMLSKLDEIDRKLLALIQADSSLSYAALGAEVGLSVSAVNERVRKLERQGVVRDYVALLDPKLVGAESLAFVEIALGNQGRAGAVAKLLAQYVEVQEVHRITGSYQLMVKLRTQGLAELEILLKTALADLSDIAGTRVVVVLGSDKETPALPIKALAPAGATRTPEP